MTCIISFNPQNKPYEEVLLLSQGSLALRPNCLYCAASLLRLSRSGGAEAQIQQAKAPGRVHARGWCPKTYISTSLRGNTTLQELRFRNGIAPAGPNVGDLAKASSGLPHPTLTAGVCCKEQWAQILYYGPCCSQLLRHRVSVQHRSQMDPALSPRRVTHTGHSTSQASGSV